MLLSISSLRYSIIPFVIHSHCVSDVGQRVHMQQQFIRKIFCMKKILELNKVVLQLWRHLYKIFKKLIICTMGVIGDAGFPGTK